MVGLQLNSFVLVVNPVNLTSDPELIVFDRFEGMKTCAGCSKPLGYGRHLTTMGRNWHPGCFCCGACDKAIVDREVIISKLSDQTKFSFALFECSIY